MVSGPHFSLHSLPVDSALTLTTPLVAIVPTPSSLATLPGTLKRSQNVIALSVTGLPGGPGHRMR